MPVTQTDLEGNDATKRYLGDGAYVAYDGYAFVLTTEDGIRTTNTIVLEPDIYVALTRYVDQLSAARGGK